MSGDSFVTVLHPNTLRFQPPARESTTMRFAPEFRYRRARVPTTGGAIVFTIFTIACSDTVVTNNYYVLPGPAQDAGDAAVENPGTSVVSEVASTTSTSEVASGREDAESTLASESMASNTTASESRTGSAGTLDGGGAVEPGSTEPSALDAAVGPLAEGAPVVNSTPTALALDVFGTFQNHYWFIATPEQVAAINEEFQGGGGYGGGWYGGDIYAPHSGGPQNTVDHLLVTTPDGQTADFGEMQVKLVGQSTGRPWTPTTLPNIKIDSDDVNAGLRLDGYEHLRFNNGVIGTIYREKFVYDYYRALGYPAPLATYGWVSSSVWAPDVKVPYIVVEAYKRGFCKQREEYFGGECPNMWEFAADMGWGVFDAPENCQFESCESTRAGEFETLVGLAQQGGATVGDLAEYVDWERFHQFQCLSWIFGTGDDAIHGGNNTVWVERPDGKFQLLPYSIDISLDVWGGGIQLGGYTSVATLCQQDEQCWDDTISTCGALVDAFIAADPVARIDTLHRELDDAGMLRSGDEQRYRDLRSTLEKMIDRLPVELEGYADNPWGQVYCPYPMAMCGNSCAYPADCYLCQDWYYEQQNDSGMVEPVPTVVAPPPDAPPPPPPAPAPLAADEPKPRPVPLPEPVPVPLPVTDAGVESGEGDGGTDYPKPDFCSWGKNDAYGIK